jgi:endo-1,4-beta-xylanase
MSLKFKVVIVFLLSFCINCTSSVNGENEKIAAKSRTALIQAGQNIENLRKGNAEINLENFKQKDLKIKIRQISHDFKFGCYLKIDGLTPEQTALYEKYFKNLFNYAVIGTYWDVTENKRDEHFWTNFDKEVAMANRNGWQIQSAPILWGTNQAGTPNWLPFEKKELDKIIEKRIARYFEKYPKTAADIEIVNEPLSPEPDVFAKRLGKNYIDSAFEQARQISPNSRLMINDYGVFGSVSANNYNFEKYFDLISELKKRQVPFDVIGIQSHANREWYSPADVAEKLNRYAAQGKPLQISEFSAQTKNYDNRKTYERVLGNYRSGIWDDAKQAEFYREFYTVAFGNPNVEAIVQWGLDDARAWLPGIGLIDEKGNLKPNYIVLDQLINKEWRTNLELDLSGTKKAEFRGFFGVYEIEVIGDGKSLVKKTFELKKNAPNNFPILN